MTLDQLMAALRQVESGGRYSVVNSIGAVGAYQVMKGNVPEWTRQALGHSLTWQQFRDNPAAQDAVARYKLNSYMKSNRGSVEAAAAMWFSGQPNPNSTKSDGYNTVRQYVDKVLAAGGGSRSSTSGAGGGGGGIGGALAPALSMDELASSYGLTSALVNSNSELKKLFGQAVAGSWTAGLFTAKLKNTKWWSTQSDTLRQYITLKYTDPATWAQKQSHAQAAMNAIAVQVGLGSQINNSGTTRILKDAIYNSLAGGWSDARIKNWMGSWVGEHGGMMQGEAGEAFDKLHSFAYLNGMQYGGYYTVAARDIVAGRSTLESEEAKIRAQAAAKYSAFAEQIKAGQNVMDLAAPYIKSTAQILELPDTDVDLFNPHVSKAMTANAKGQAYSLWQYETDLRNDPLWKKTKNAQDGLMGVAHQVLQNFGMVS